MDEFDEGKRIPCPSCRFYVQRTEGAPAKSNFAATIKLNGARTPNAIKLEYSSG